MLQSLLSHPSFPARLLPNVRRTEQDPAQADFALLTSALKRLLAQWPPRVTRRHFPVATRVYQALRIQACLLAPVRLPPHLLSDLCHEIAEHVDASVRGAAVRCMRRCAVMSQPLG